MNKTEVKACVEALRLIRKALLGIPPRNRLAFLMAVTAYCDLENLGAPTWPEDPITAKFANGTNPLKE